MVDIIVPIYNAYKVVDECIASVIKHTNLNEHRLILINDKSTDENIASLLENYRSKYTFLNIEVLHNEVNLGFVGTVNRGMKYSTNDVILLNSDTEVSDYWLESMIKCAYSQPDVASVTALSNNATLASVPKGLQPNNLPNNMTFDEYAKMVHERSFRRYPEIPTAHGFCMYIRRNVLDVVGYFDQVAFGKGYGEENDFSYRCIEYGYKHLLCDDVIVYHKESQSFNEKRDQLIKNNMKILRKRYPIQTQYTDDWCGKLPIRNICNNILYGVNAMNRKSVLFLIHDWSNYETNLGGTTIHCKDLIQNLRYKYNFYVLSPENGSYMLRCYFENEEMEMTLMETSMDNKSYYNAEYKKMLEMIIDGLGISYVHVHHMIGHYFDVVDVCNQKNISVAITLHDFYGICPTINLLYMGKEYCLGLENKNCIECLKWKNGISNNIVSDWQNHWREFLSRFDKIITPSESTKNIYSKFYDLDYTVREHGVDLEIKKGRLRKKEEEFNVAFVGVMLPHKGSDILEYLIRNCKQKNIKFHLFGDAQVGFLKKNKANYINHGRYVRAELPKLLQEANIHLVCNLSIWPETYSYTLTETIASGVPVLSYNIGAVGERINKYKFGWTIENRINEEVLNKILYLQTHVDEYNKIINFINNYSIKSITDMCNEYDIQYDEHTIREQNIQNFKELCLIDDNQRKISDLRSRAITPELMAHLNSRRFKLVKNIKTPKFFKKVINLLIKIIKR